SIFSSDCRGEDKACKAWFSRTCRDYKSKKTFNSGNRASDRRRAVCCLYGIKPAFASDNSVANFETLL
ncbi:MAG: hypothetical protein LBC98_04475, partial [Prevotellaceae bacterium]|nr:hypothetical protein [Prevotellaceae bacterium]